MTGQELSNQILDSVSGPLPMLLLKTTAVLAAGWCGHWIMRNSGPRCRLFWWRGVACALLLVGVVSLSGPQVPLHVLPANEQPTTTEPAAVPVADANPISSPRVDIPALPHRAVLPHPMHDSASPLQENNTAAPHREQVKTTITATPKQVTGRINAPLADTTIANVELRPDAGADRVAATPASSGIALWSWIGGLWLAGVVWCAARLLLASVRLRKFLSAAEAVPESIDAVYRDLKARVGCRVAVKVRRHNGISSPVLYGIRRPVILIPGWMCDDACRDDWPGVFAHELSHIRSCDLVWQALMHSVSILLWFHPLAWRLRRTHVLACELKADNDSATVLGETRGYVRTLARVALASASRSPRIGLAMARTSEISSRLAFLKKAVFPAPPRLRVLAVVSLCGLLACSLLGSLKFAAAESEAVADQQPAKTAEAVEKKSAKKSAKSPQAAPKSQELVVSMLDESGKPIAGASMIMRLGDERKTHHPDAAGRMTLQIPQPTPRYVILTANVPGYVRTQARWSNFPGRLPQPIPAKIAFRLERGTTIGGKVVDADGKPIVGATVLVSGSGRRATPNNPTGQSIYEFPAKTDAKGIWKCDTAPSKLTRVSLRLNHPDFVNGAHSRGVPASQWPQLRKLAHVSTMERGLLVEGVVRGPDGKPLAGAVLALGNSPFGASGRHPKPKTDKTGAYRFKNVAKGDTAITVIAPGCAPQLKRIEVSDELDSVNFQLRKGKTIRIRVVDMQGKPVAGVRVVPDTWRGHRSLLGLYEGVIPNTTDKNGRITWDGAPDDEVQFDIFKLNYMSARNQKMTQQKEEYVVTLPPALRISGRVIDSQTKKPIPAFKVLPGMVFQNSGRRHWARYEIVEGRNGRYATELTSPYAGRLIRIEAAGYGPATSRLIKSDEGKVTIDFELTPAQNLEGIVLTRDGKPISGAQVYLFTATNSLYVRNGAAVDRNRGIRTTTDKSGKFHFPSQAETYGLFVVADSGYSIVPEADFEQLPRIHVEPWAKVAGEMKIGTKPGRKLQMSLNLDNDTRQEKPRIYFDYDATTDGKGRFEFHKVPTHLKATIHRSIVLSQNGSITSVGGSHSRSIDLLPGKTTTVTIGGTGRPVTGQLQLPEGVKDKVDWNAGFNSIREARPPGFVRVPGVPVPHQPGYSLRISADGRFRVDDLPPGNYELNAKVYESPRGNDRRFGRGKLIGRLMHTFTIAPIPGGRTDDAQNLGALKLVAP